MNPMKETCVYIVAYTPCLKETCVYDQKICMLFIWSKQKKIIIISWSIRHKMVFEDQIML